MNGEDLWNGLTDIRDDQIERAAPPPPKKGPRRKRWAAPVAAALAVVLLLTALLLPRMSGGKTGGGGFTVAAAELPKREKYSEANYDRWFEERRALRQTYESYDGALDSFAESAVPLLLSGDADENRVCSPLNIYLALSMLSEMTDGESRAQLLSLLGAASLEDVRANAKALWNANYQDDGTVTSLLANSVWMSDTLEYVQKTMDTLAQDYRADSFRGEMGSGAYNEALQSWVNEHTGNRLTEQASGLSFDPETVLALVSTIYYRARWKYEFNENRTEPGTFHAPSGDGTIDFMHQTADGHYYWGERFSAVPKGLQNSGEMWLILPDEGVSPDKLLESGEAVDFLLQSDSWENSQYAEIELSVPKFDVVRDTDLISSLSALGVTDVFDGASADFSPMLPHGLLEEVRPYVSAVRHAARVTVDEEGCEAAAYTEIAMTGAGAPPVGEKIEFTLDRPFLFAITGDDGSLLFVGVVNHP